MKIISVINDKGGVSKTTISGNLIYGLKQRGYRVLALDIDPQCNLTTALIPRLGEKAQKTSVRTIKNWFEDILNFEENPTTISQIARKEERTWSKYIQLVPGGDLEAVRRQITGKIDELRPKEYINFYNRLRAALHSLETEYDFVIIDCPPSADSPITQCALVATDYYIIPTIADKQSSQGIESLHEKIKKFQQDFNSHATVEKQCIAEPLGIIFTMLNPHNQRPIQVQQDWINRISAARFPIFESYLYENNSLFSDNCPVLSRSLTSAEKNHISVKHLNQMVDELLERMNEPLKSPKLQERRNNILMKINAKRAETYGQAA